jgi:hypothetical protein
MGGMKAFSRYLQGGYVRATALKVRIGATSVLFASAPMAMLKEAFSWRILFIIGSSIIGLTLMSIWLLTSDDTFRNKDMKDSPGLAGLLQIIKNNHFRRFALLNFSIFGGFLACQGRWAGPYLLLSGVKSDPQSNRTASAHCITGQAVHVMHGGIRKGPSWIND